MLDHAHDGFSETGRLWLRDAVAQADQSGLTKLFPKGGKPGARLPADDPLFDFVNKLPFQADLLARWPGMRPVRMVTFAKSAGTNWGVTWHQDRMIAVAEKADVPGFTNWSQKNGAWHCEPPVSLLHQMLFVRLHLDANTSANGAMQIALGSHTKGIVPATQADAVAATHPWETTTAAPGDVLVMAMTLLHKSDPAHISDARRAIRIDYAPYNLPAPLRWATQA